jgi:oxygen-independent coproporphyrinogen-3 oxidase
MSTLTTLTRMWLTRSIRPFSFTDECDPVLPIDDANNLGLYVHIPFCKRLCAFCPYCKTVYHEDLVAPFVEALEREIDMVGSRQKRKTVTSLYFGGGTPALLANEMGRIITAIQKHFDITEGIGVELHPDDVTAEKLRTLQDAGVTKISVGIQSFDTKTLKVLGRGAADFDLMFQAIREVPFETVAMDFIFALPGQTLEDLTYNIETAFANGANHIALYPFIDFTFTSRGFDKMSEPDKKALLFQITDYCESKGYVRDSIWTFAKPGTKKYSSMTRDNFVGFGPSATTLLAKQFKVNTFSIPAYIRRINQGSLPTALTLRFSDRQRMIYYLFWTAYTTHVSAEDFERFFDRKLGRSYGLELALMRLLGMVRKDNDDYTMTAKGAYYYHYYENHYTLSYIDQMWNLMRVEDFPESLVIR